MARIEVTLAVGGNEFSELVHANSYDAARRVALARNPNAQVVRVTDVFEAEPMIQEVDYDDFDTVYRAPRSSSGGDSFLDRIVTFLGLIFVGWLGLYMLTEMNSNNNNQSHIQYEVSETIYS